ncbi:hypothetical protein HYPBUDRAFT_107397 [Hyphopichia burtonii NRRL Y-1933]|uniref:Uncharacterized protein n=1 Tax=Hyphopichia burtonii NRRL Y-1933 TaxID=984485 RepID=A0A1E4RLC6_9ASCO|nr:hypothetical protein HYPBUDRAFT_107397 [Hyphopichia burtonii NRRL Y-1933]ODV67915.1 hypothetical protein HYPBUDRAFT_107397 [Hyphopichia burtonii NRRL Y-1933]
MHTHTLARSVRDDLPAYSIYSDEGESSGSNAYESNSNENLRHEPNDTATNYNFSNNLTSSLSRLSFEDTSIDENLIITDENTNNWTETIINNIHNLRSLTKTGNEYSKAIDISIHFTKDVGKVNEKPTLIDPLLHEYRKGDFINGHIYITNTSDFEVPFTMFYVMFQGHFLIASKNESKPVKFKKFLEMFDFSASYNEARIDRLISENNKDELFQTISLIDPIDNAELSLAERVLKPKTTYKRFFTFKIPERLLDSECNVHNLSYHTELPPTLGILKYFQVNDEDKFKDFLFPDSSITYGLTARFIGKAYQYNEKNEKSHNSNPTLVNSDGDEFVIFTDNQVSMRILQQAPVQSTLDYNLKTLEIETMYKNLISRLKEKIEIGEEIVQSLNENHSDEAIQLAKKLDQANKNDLAKARQLYSSKHSRDVKAKYGDKIIDKCDNYEMIIPLMKKKLLHSNSNGTLKVSSPKMPIYLRYIPPPKFRLGEPIDNSTWKFDMPINLSFTSGSLLSTHKELPRFKKILCDLVVATFKSKKFDIPLQLNHNFLFKNDFKKFYNDPTTDNDSFVHIIKKPFQEMGKKYYDLFQTLGSDRFRVEASLIDDLKAMCGIEERFMKLKIDDFKINGSKDMKDLSDLNWDLNDRSNSFEQSLSLSVNVESADFKYLQSKNRGNESAYDKFCFVPSFQTCNMARMYYFDLCFQLTTNEYFHVKVPAVIEKW